MPSFKTGSIVTCLYDPTHLLVDPFVTWRQQPVDAPLIARGEPDLDNYPRGGIAEMLSEGALSLTVHPNGALALSGLAQVPTSLGTGPNLTIRYSGFNFRKRSLNEDEAEILRRYQGYPVEVTTCPFLETDPDLDTERRFVEFTRGIEYPVMRSIIKIRAWLGEDIVGASDHPLVDYQGSPLIWPNQLRGDRTAVERVPTEGQAALLPAWASATPSEFNEQEILPFRFNYFGETFLNLFQNSPLYDSTRAVNAVSHVRVIMSPERVDSDGYLQPAPYPPAAMHSGTGAISLITPIVERGSFAYSGSFTGRVLSSRLDPEIINEVTGVVEQRARQTMLLDVPDRTKAGLAAMPATYNSSINPDLIISGRGFWLLEIEEQTDERLIMRVSTRPGGG